MRLTGGCLLLFAFIGVATAASHVLPHDGATPVFIAAQNGHCSVVSLLLAHGARVSIPRLDSATPLWTAAQMNHSDVCRILLQAGHPVDIVRKKGHFNHQLQKRDIECEEGKLVANPTKKATYVKIIADSGHTLFSIDNTNSELSDINRMVFHTFNRFFPIPSNDRGENTAKVYIVKEPVEDGLNLKVLASNNVTIFQKVIKGSSEGLKDTTVKCVLLTSYKVIVESGLDVNHRDGYNMTSLLWASLFGDEELSKKLVEKGADVSSTCPHGIPPLLHAISAGKHNLVATLIKHGAKVNEHFGKKGPTPLHLAAFYGRLECAKVLLDNGAEISITDSDGETPLHTAVSRSQVELAKELIARGANINAKTKKGMTPLHTAMRVAEEDLIDLLIQKGADIDSKDNDNATPLIIALSSHEDFASAMVKHLLEHHKPDLNIKTKDGKTALAIATELGFTKVQDLLKSHGAQ